MGTSTSIDFADAQGNRFCARTESFGGPIVLVSFFQGAEQEGQKPLFRSRLDAGKAMFLDPLPVEVASLLPELADRISRRVIESERAG